MAARDVANYVPPELPRRDEDPLAWLIAHNAKREPSYVYKPFRARQPMTRGSLPRASTMRMLPRPVRQRRRVRRVAGQPARRSRSRSPGRLADDPG